MVAFFADPPDNYRPTDALQISLCIFRVETYQKPTSSLRIEQSTLHFRRNLWAECHGLAYIVTIILVTAGQHFSADQIDHVGQKRHCSGFDLYRHAACLCHFICVAEQPEAGHIRAAVGCKFLHYFRCTGGRSCHCVYGCFYRTIAGFFKFYACRDRSGPYRLCKYQCVSGPSHRRSLSLYRDELHLSLRSRISSRRRRQNARRSRRHLLPFIAF